MVFGGTGDRDDLIFWSTLAGDRDEPVWTTDLHGRGRSRTVRRVPVMAPAQIMNLPEGRVLVFRRGINPVLGRAQMAWERRDVRVHAFTVAHPEQAAMFARWAAAVQRRWARVIRPVRAVLAATRRWMTAANRRVWATASRWTRSGWACVARIGRRAAAPRGVPVDLDPPTVELLVPVPSGTPGTSESEGRP